MNKRITSKKRNCSKRGIIFSLFLSLTFSSLFAQEFLMELGGSAGGSYYMGDANMTQFFKNVEKGYGLLWRYNLNMRSAIKVDFQMAQISGDTDFQGNVFPNAMHLTFNKQLYALSGRYEFNFYDYGYGYRNSKRYAPYLFIGTGVVLATKEGETAFGITIPFGVGFKYKIAPRLNLGIEFCFNKTTTEDLDAVAGTKGLNDPYQIKSSFLKNKDWYGTTMLSLSYDFMAKKMKCNN